MQAIFPHKTIQASNLMRKSGLVSYPIPYLSFEKISSFQNKPYANYDQQKKNGGKKNSCC